MNEAPTFIDGFQSVFNVYGMWPLFHDAEVINLTMDRSKMLFDSVHNAKIKITLHCQDTYQSDEQNHLKGLVKHSLIRFEFEEVDDVKFEGSNHQNALFSLPFAP